MTDHRLPPGLSARLNSCAARLENQRNPLQPQRSARPHDLDPSSRPARGPASYLPSSISYLLSRFCFLLCPSSLSLPFSARLSSIQDPTILQALTASYRLLQALTRLWPPDIGRDNGVPTRHRPAEPPSRRGRAFNLRFTFHASPFQLPITPDSSRPQVPIAPDSSRSPSRKSRAIGSHRQLPGATETKIAFSLSRPFSLSGSPVRGF